MCHLQFWCKASGACQEVLEPWPMQECRKVSEDIVLQNPLGQLSLLLADFASPPIGTQLTERCEQRQIGQSYILSNFESIIIIHAHWRLLLGVGRVQPQSLTNRLLWILIEKVLSLHDLLEDVVVAKEFDLIALLKLEKIPFVGLLEASILVAFFQSLMISKRFTNLLLFLCIEHLEHRVILSVHDITEIVALLEDLVVISQVQLGAGQLAQDVQI